MNLNEVEKLWMCPKCRGKLIVCIETKIVKTGEGDFEDYYMNIPKKIWCMKCQKEYSVRAAIDREEVKFT